METIDVVLPNGRTISGVPKDTPKDEIRRRAVAAGLIKDEEFDEPKPFVDQGPLIYRNPVQEDAAPAVEEEVYESVPTTQELRPYTGEAGPIRRAVFAAQDAGEFLKEEASRVVWGGTVVPTMQALLDFRNIAVEKMTGRAIAPEDIEAQQTNLMESFKGIRWGIAPEEVSVRAVTTDEGGAKHVFEMDEQGRVTSDRPETFVGAVLPYIVPYTGAYKAIVSMPLLASLGTTARVGIAGAAAGNVADQLISDPYADNVANILDQWLSEDGGKPTVLSYLAAQEDDDMLERRLKMMGVDTILGVMVGGGLWGITKGAAWVKNSDSAAVIKARERDITSLTPEELKEVWLESMKNIREEGRATVEIVTGPDGRPLYENGRLATTPVGDGFGVRPPEQDLPDIVPTGNGQGIGVFANTGGLSPSTPQQVDQALQQIEAQTGRGVAPFLRRIYQQAGTSRGYLTPELFEMRNTTQAAARAYAARAENVARRLTIQVDRMARDAADSSNPFSIPDVTDARGAADHLQRQANLALDGNQEVLQSLPEGIRNEVNNARELIDSLSQQLADSPTVMAELKEDVTNNLGSYMRRSYEIFENPRYEPNRIPATNEIQMQILRDNPGMPFDEALKMAEDRVTGIIGDAREGFATFMGNANRLNDDLLRRRGDLTPAMRELLGEVTNPADNIVLTVQRLASYTQNDRFLQSFKATSEGSFLQPNATGIYTTKISGTNSSLDGMFTTPELNRALMNTESNLLNINEDTILAASLRNWTAYKAGSQSAKTVLNHITHFKNVFGAMMTRTANGSMPLTESTIGAARVVFNQAAGRGDVGLDELSERYIRLGVTDTNVQVRQISDLMESARGDSRSFSARLEEFTQRYAGDTAEAGVRAASSVISPVVETATKIYRGVDDLVKIAEFEDYLSVLKRAHPEKSVDELEEQASAVIKRTMINYDMIPKGIKKLRHLPFGNFVGFPSEVMRTSLEIPKVAFEEIRSGNQELIERGTRRLLGWGMTAGFGGEALSETAMYLNGVTPEEEEALKEYLKRPWSERPMPWMMRDGETGELMVMDGSSIDTYHYFREPFKAILAQIESGVATNDSIDSILFGSIKDVFMSLASPFIGESMATESWMEFYSATQSEDGRSRSGTMYFPEGKNGWDVIMKGFETFIGDLQPGSIDAMVKAYPELTEQVREWTGEPTEPDMVKWAQVGFPYRRVDPEAALKYAAQDYAGATRTAPRVSINFRTTPEEVIEQYTVLNRDAYQTQQALYKKANMARALGMEWAEVHQLLTGVGVLDDTATNIINGKFVPVSLGPAAQDAVRQRIYSGSGRTHTMTQSEFFNNISRLQNTMAFTPLDEYEDDEAGVIMRQSETGERSGFFLGGLVKVPNAPSLPSTRIDKLTGQPYDVQAGGAYLEEGRLIQALATPRTPMSSGGIVKNSLLNSLRRANGRS